MDDTIRTQPDMADLFQVAVGQQGYFTSRQAHEAGVSNALIKHHVRTGRFIRVYRGVFRFRDYPSSPREHLVAAWLAAGRDRAAVSHESALDLLDLTDVVPVGIHLTVPREARHVRTVPGVRLHTTTIPLGLADTQMIDGIRLTTVERTIVDVAAADLSPEHVEVAVTEALERGLTTPRRLRAATASRSQRVQSVIEQGIRRAGA